MLPDMRSFEEKSDAEDSGKVKSISFIKERVIATLS